MDWICTDTCVGIIVQYVTNSCFGTKMNLSRSVVLVDPLREVGTDFRIFRDSFVQNRIHSIWLNTT
jgi:hypothetical protein